MQILPARQMEFHMDEAVETEGYVSQQLDLDEAKIGPDSDASDFFS
jgi:hypothetical protein